jgi:nitroimidazol reductase NimA-like FMN-containing flavoprotein (pyridoxamine 5'-phosphate oxidase superfamily)
MERQPTAELDPAFSDQKSEPTPWPEAEALLASAPIWWLSTVRPDGRPHVTPLIAVWDSGALHFCTGLEERKARNLAANRQVTLTTTTRNDQHDGLDLVVEGEAVRVPDDARLRELADAWVAKYGEEWRFHVRDGAFHHTPEGVRPEDPGAAHVFAVAPATAFSFRRGTYSQTRHRFG